MPSNCFFVVIFFVGLTISGVQSDEVDCKGNYAENCDTTANIQEIECQESDGACTCKDGSGVECATGWNPDVDGDTNGDITYQTLKDQCETNCRNLNDQQVCRFYKYIERRGKNHCYAMSQDQCTEQAQDEACIEPHCKSGYVLRGGETCEGNTGGGDDGIIVPGHFCPTGSKPKHSASTMPDNYLRWECRDMNREIVDIYGNGEKKETAPAGTRCTTRPGCGEEEYVYICSLTADEGWVAEKGAPEEPIDQANKFLNDVKCNAPELFLDPLKYEQDGLEIQCVELGNGQVDTDNPNQPKVESQNNCLLLCDWFPVVNFYTKGNKWFYVDMEDDNLEEKEITDPNTTGNIIYCW